MGEREGERERERRGNRKSKWNEMRWISYPLLYLLPNEITMQNDEANQHWYSMFGVKKNLTKYKLP